MTKTEPRLFERTKLQCFGRYAALLPEEAEQVFGPHEIDGGFKRYRRSDYSDAEGLLRARWDRERQRHPSSEMKGSIASGPVPSTKYFWHYWSPYFRERDTRLLSGTVPIGLSVYLYESMTSKREGVSPDQLFANMTALMRGMRAWDGHSVPREPGVCIEGAFIEEPTNRFREIMGSGFYFPSLPDVSFSVMSNKNAATDGPNGVGLLDRVQQARSGAGLLGGYPYTILRSGKRTLHGLWQGEEVLTRSHDDGALRFEWAMVGEPRNVARPAHLNMALMTKVANNRVGAARSSSLSEPQAIALWDRLVEGVKFRVMVPGATPESVALR